MIQSWMVLAVLLNSPFAGASSTESVVGKINVPKDAGIENGELFVAWTDKCWGTKPDKKLLAKKLELVQSGNRYAPKAMVALVGQKLGVHNADKIQHNSFALKSVKFDSGLQKPDSTYDVLLDKPGVTKVFCRIHPSMVGEVLVLPHTCYKELRWPADFDGKRFTFHGENGKMWLWSPRLKKFLSAEPKEKNAGVEFDLKKEDFVPTASAPSATYQ